jgi:hypothetical protein
MVVDEERAGERAAKGPVSIGSSSDRVGLEGKGSLMTSMEDRLQRLEDQLAIYQVVCSYGYAADGLNAEVLGQIYAEDGVYEISDREASFEGRAAVQGIVQSPGHLDLVRAGAAHMSTLPYVVVNDDEAVATCHTMVVQHKEGEFYVGRLSASRIELERSPDGEWLIKRRTNQLLTGDERGSALLGRLTDGSV